MKIRLGFVSNSSSSSYTCDVCGETVSGWDVELAEPGMMRCEHGHILCEGHISLDLDDWLNWKVYRDILLDKKYIFDEDKEILRSISTPDEFWGLLGDDIWEENFNYIRYSIPAKYCPLCTFEGLKDSELITFLLDQLGITREQAVKRAGGIYEDYATFREECLQIS